jgi:hypothetical protein
MVCTMLLTKIHTFGSIKAPQSCWHALGSHTHTNLELTYIAAESHHALKLHMEAHTAKVKRVALTILLTAHGTPVLLTKASAQRSIIHACGSTQSHHNDTAAHTVAATNHCVSHESVVKQEDSTAHAAAHAAA